MIGLIVTDTHILFGEWSSLMRVLTWKVGGFGFPFGIVLPFAVVGLVYYWRRHVRANGYGFCP